MADVDLPSIDPAPGTDAPRTGGAKGALARNIGPLPVWGWIAVLGVAGAVVVRRRRAATTTAPDQVTYAQQAQVPTIGGAAGGGASPIVSGGAARPTTNDEWRSTAVTTLTAKGYSSLSADTAVAKYLQGAAMTTTERALIDIALGSLGTPPAPPPAAPSAPASTPLLPPGQVVFGAESDAQGGWTSYVGSTADMGKGGAQNYLSRNTDGRTKFAAMPLGHGLPPGPGLGWSAWEPVGSPVGV